MHVQEGRNPSGYLSSHAGGFCIVAIGIRVTIVEALPGLLTNLDKELAMECDDVLAETAPYKRHPIYGETVAEMLDSL
ncbi:MAG: hypothetical protein SPG10_14225 [Enterocloster clostridioformis]|nr:hypothetical protein [Enterocloster clostridioformis]